MKLVIFGLSMSSSWGNGHATLWRALAGALAQRGHQIVFFEKDVPYYAAHRDYQELPGGKLVLYSHWNDVLPLVRRHLADTDVAMVTSYCPDGIAATDLVLHSNAAAKVFYDLDTPVTLNEIRAGRTLSYIGPRGLRDFDLVLSYTGGEALKELQAQLGATLVAPLYGSVDPAVHHPVPSSAGYRADFSYLGTYAEDRQEILNTLFIETARCLPGQRFLIGGAQYPAHFPWANNIFFVQHVPPPDHPAFYSSSRLTLNVTRGAMAKMGYCPSGRLFEAAACGTPILTDWWEGLDMFFEPGKEILVARSTIEAVEALRLPEEEISRIAQAARERTLSEHTADCRAADLERALELIDKREATVKGVDFAAPQNTAESIMEA
jgi:spore maturation protein CgeB